MAKASIPTRWLFLPAVVVALVAVALDVAQWLRAIPLWVDEEMIALNVRDRAFEELAGPLWLAQSAPLGWLFAQRSVVVTLGDSELLLRLLPLLFGIGTLAAALWIGRRWLHPSSTVLFILICALGQWLSHYRFEVKHYSADVFWALLLPALAAWAAEDDEAPMGPQWRWTRWWAVAALAQWFANGAYLAVPGCAVFLTAVILRRRGIAEALRFAATGILWLASLGVHYLLSLQYAHHNRYLHTYWSEHVVPQSMGILESAVWMAGRLEGLASNPAGSTLGIWLWACATGGFLFTTRRRLAGAFVTVPVAGFALAALRLVPLNDRLALWIVPSLYVGVVLLFDSGARLIGLGWRPRQPLRVVAGALAAMCALLVAGNISVQGYRQLDLGLPTDSNHGGDDRSAVSWLMERKQPGDALISTRLGWPALWWYGGIALTDRRPGGRLPDGSVMYEVTHERSTPGCRDRLREALQPHRRALVHVGFPDMPEAFPDLLLGELATIGAVVEESRFSDQSRTAVIVLRGADSTASPAAPGTRSGPSTLPGCVLVHPMRRW